MVIQDLLHAIAVRLECGPLHLDDNHLCRLHVDELELFVELIPQYNRVFIYTLAGYLPSTNKTPLLMDLMSANLFHQGTGGHGAVFGLMAETEEVLLYQHFNLHSDSIDSCVSALVAIIEASKQWQPRLQPIENQLATNNQISIVEIQNTLLRDI